jgi:hypothetical protein
MYTYRNSGGSCAVDLSDFTESTTKGSAPQYLSIFRDSAETSAPSSQSRRSLLKF